MKISVGLLFFVSAYVLPILALTTGGYYWRQYAGIVPHDALEAGKDNKGLAIYIGMTLHPATVLLPGTIYPGERKIYYEYGLVEYSADLDILILCVENKEQFRWTNTYKDRLVTDITENNEFEMIGAGSDRKRLVFVGRTTIHGNETVVGKVLVVDGVFNFMWLARYQEGWFVTDYEVLLYDSNVIVEKECGAVKNITIVVYNNN